MADAAYGLWPVVIVKRHVRDVRGSFFHPARAGATNPPKRRPTTRTPRH
jgi:hypothetical protein